MILRRSVKETIVMSQIVPCSVGVSNDDNSNNNIEDPTDLGDGFFFHIFRCSSRCCQFQNKFVPVNKVLSTTANRLY